MHHKKGVKEGRGEVGDGLGGGSSYIVTRSKKWAGTRDGTDTSTSHHPTPIIHYITLKRKKKVKHIKISHASSYKNMASKCLIGYEGSFFSLHDVYFRIFFLKKSIVPPSADTHTPLPAYSHSSWKAFCERKGRVFHSFFFSFFFSPIVSLSGCKKRFVFYSRRKHLSLPLLIHLNTCGQNRSIKSIGYVHFLFKYKLYQANRIKLFI